MNKTTHTIYISTLITIVVAVTITLVYIGMSYYGTELTERFYHDDHKLLKPSGPLGHGLGIIGTLMIIIGVGMYMLRKRNRALARYGVLKHWLEFHIFLCTLGPILILFHTAFKFGGIVSISFWSMVAVVLSGVIGRFIYIQIPRTIQGRELSLNEVHEMKTDIGKILRDNYQMDEMSYATIIASAFRDDNEIKGSLLTREVYRFRQNRKSFKAIKDVVKQSHLSKKEHKKIITLLKNEIRLNGKIERLTAMQNLFKYWHVAHLPFALIMLIIMVIHVIVTLTLGYKWIF
jgi:hypothetical protein